MLHTPRVILEIALIALLITFASLFVLGPPAHALQDNATQSSPVEQVAETPEDPIKQRLDALRSLLDKIFERREQVTTLQQQLKDTTDEQEKQALSTELENVNAVLAEREDSFMELITGIPLSTYDQTPVAEDTSVLEELQTIFEPILNKLKEVSTRTRRVERLRSDIAESKDLEQRIASGLQQTEALKAETEDPRLLQAFDGAVQTIEQRLEELRQNRAIDEAQLQKIESDRGIWKSFQQFFGDLLGRHVLNLIIMLLILIGTFALLRLAYSWLLNRPSVRKHLGEVYWFRIADVIIRGLIFILASVLGLFVLYFLNDWILIGLFALLAIGFLWSMKDSVPLQMQHAQLLLNIGAVRERERVIYRGLPWEVKPIGYFTHLVNPALEGGRVRVKLKELDEMSSRPFSRNDQWFPTKKHDWVLLADATYGQVILQTPDHVVMRIFGVSEKTYSTQAFLDNSPLNLSKGYGLFVTFGVDYAHQADVTGSIPAALEEEIKQGFSEAGQAEHMKSLLVEFNDASASSLDFAVFAQFTAQTADRYFKMRRLLLRFLVESCTRNGWSIPFTQVTVHAAGGSEALPPAPAPSLEETPEEA